MSEKSKHNPIRRQATLRRQARLIKIEKMLLRGVTNQSEIASAFGMTQAQISYDVRDIEAKWKKDSPEAEDRRKKRVRQLESVYMTAANSYELSRVGKKGEVGPGDVNYLDTMRRCLVEICKLEGIYPDKVKIQKVEGEVRHAHAHLHQGKVDLSNVPSEVILDAKVAFDRLKSSMDEDDGQKLLEDVETKGEV